VVKGNGHAIKKDSMREKKPGKKVMGKRAAAAYQIKEK
jgi:hypothetical protein